MFTPEQTAQLSDTLKSSHVKDRTQSGRKVSYVEGWHVIAEANRIFGFGNWERETVYLKEVCRYQSERKDRDGRPLTDRTTGEVMMNWKVGYEAKVRVRVWDGDKWIAREGTGYGQGTMGDLFDAMESAGKEAETDSMKRCFITFGNPFGLALYDKTQNGVEDDRAPPPAPPSRPQSDTQRDRLRSSPQSPALTAEAEDDSLGKIGRELVAKIHEVPTMAALLALVAGSDFKRSVTTLRENRPPLADEIETAFRVRKGDLGTKERAA